MRHIYMAIWYGCNQHCTGCPVEHNTNRGEQISAADVRKYIEQNIGDNEGLEVTISGGEPTLHPEFLEILDAIMDNGACCTVLTNAEKLDDKSFCDEILNHVDIRRFRIVTTIHGSTESLHEKQNQSQGSFRKSIQGLQYMSFRGVQVVIKHCVTGKNAADTSAFIARIDDLFHPSVPIQLWGIDYSGLSREQAKDLYKPFKEIRKDVEQGLDTYLEIREKNDRGLTMHNLPLCCIDPYYWDLMPDVQNNMPAYAGYFDPTTVKGSTGDDSGKLSSECAKCDVNEYCQGAYRSLFEYFGDDTVYAIKEVK